MNILFSVKCKAYRNTNMILKLYKASDKICTIQAKPAI